MKIGGVVFVILMLWAKAVADSGYRNPLERFTELVHEVAQYMNLSPPDVLPTNVALFGYERVAIGTLKKASPMPGRPEYVVFVRLFFLSEHGRLVWRVGIAHELCHIKFKHFGSEKTRSDEGELEAEQCAYDQNTDEAYYAWARMNFSRHQYLSLYALVDEEMLREGIRKVVGIELREP